MRGLATAALTAAVLAATGCAGARTREVVVEGVAAVGADGADAARERALADARRRAVEQAAGVEIGSFVVTNGGVAVLDRVSATARGALRGYRVVSEGRADGAVTVRIRARVEPDGAAPAPAGTWPPGTGPRLRLAAALEPSPVESAARGALRQDWLARGGTLAEDGAPADLVLFTAASAA
ncbi:MAG: flagellar assembly protein T N-terminal domain-containing protein, partial [Elusimicrobiota bacterium]|nr:flagellar assembly protein T N-terminal domain-containing protein [Elusimicrobiota bacterium]